MKILIGINHPAHVHFYKNFIYHMKENGHDVLVTNVKKEVSEFLLEKYNIDFINIKLTRENNIINKIINQIKYEIIFYKIAKNYSPDIITGIGGTTATHISYLLKSKSIIFTDTEHAKIANSLTFPFADTVCTPTCYKHEIGPKQIRYKGYHELAYLHPNYFQPNPEVLSEIGLNEEDRFIIVRFVSWKAIHDVGHQGIEDKVSLVKELGNYGRVLITSEGELPPELQDCQMKLSPEKLHDLLFFATLYIGEGATTASECAILGTHAIYVNTLSLGYISEQSEEYGLVSDFSQKPFTDEDIINEAKSLLNNLHLKNESRRKSERMLKEKIDVTEFMVWFVENYPESFDKMRKGQK